MKIAIATATFFGAALVDLLHSNGYGAAPSAPHSDGDLTYVLVNTEAKTFKDSNTAGERAIYDPTKQWGAIEAIVKGLPAPATGIVITLVAGSAPAAAPVAAVPAAPAFVVGDRVTATNSAKTKAKFRLQPNYVYTVDRVTAKGNLGLAGLPNDEYLPTRFTKVAATTTTAALIAQAPAIDASGNTLQVGDTVLVKIAAHKKPIFRLRENGVAVITSITPKGALGFAFDADNQFLARRVQKVTLSPATGNVRSGDLVVAKARRDGRFVLPENTALTFRGTTTSGNFILNGYTTDQYAPKRFKKVVPVTAR